MNPNVQTNRQRWMRPVRAEDIPVLEALAAQDGHSVVLPSHVFEKGGEIVGCISLGRAVFTLPWFHSERCQVRDTLYFVNQAENLAAALMPPDHSGILCVPFVPNSPLHPYIAGLGYQNGGSVSLTFKKVK